MSREARLARWIAFAARSYPRSWRAEYGREFEDLLRELKPDWRMFANVLAGSIRMHLTTSSTWIKLPFALALVGAIAGGVASFAVAPHYISSAIISVTPQADPLRPASPEVLHQRAASWVALLESEVLSRTSLARVVEELDLYPRQRQRMALEDVLDHVRGDIRIYPRPSNGGADPIVFGISFDYSNPESAKATVQALADKFRLSGLYSGWARMNVYSTFWHDMSKSAPPPPPEALVRIVEYPSLPKRASTSRAMFVAWGSLAGVFTGLLIALTMRRRRGLTRLVGFAAAGGALAFAVSFAFPVRYTSTATLIISPAIVTQDPLATPPPATPASELLRQMTPEVLSIQNLSRMIRDRRLDLYPRERAARPIEDVARTMLGRDLRIVPVNPASGVNIPAPAFRISFSGPDRIQVRKIVQAIVSAFEDRRIARAREDYLQAPAIVRAIYQRKAGENLAILDPPSLPFSPASPSRTAIAAAGAGLGLLLGIIVLCLPGTNRTALPQVGATGSPAAPDRPNASYFAIDFGLGWAWPRIRWGR